MMYSTVYASSGSLFEGDIAFGDFILMAISIFVLAAGLLSLLFILWGGLLLILSGGKDEKIKPAINTIRFAIIWVVITVLTIFLFPVFGRLLGIDVEKYAKPQRIFEKIEEIWNLVFGWESSTSYNTETPDSLDDFPADFSDL